LFSNLLLSLHVWECRMLGTQTRNILVEGNHCRHKSETSRVLARLGARKFKSG